MKTLARKIALKFFFVIALLVICLSLFLITMVNWNSRRTKDNEIFDALNVLTSTLKKGDSLYVAEAELPYYITYTVYEEESMEAYATNDPFLPILPLTHGKTVSYTKENFYTDGDLRVLYTTSEINFGGKDYIIQVSLSTDKDTSQEYYSYYAKLLMLSFIPLLLISYFASFLIAKRTLNPIVKFGGLVVTEYSSSSQISNSAVVSYSNNTITAIRVCESDILLTYSYLDYSIQQLLHVVVY